MEKDSSEIFRKLKKDLSTYVELKLELLKLDAYERTGKVIAVLSYGAILLFLAFFAILSCFRVLHGRTVRLCRFRVRCRSRTVPAVDRCDRHRQRKGLQESSEYCDLGIDNK